VIQASIRRRLGSLHLEVELEASGGPLVLVGPNGSGKTSLLLLILGALRPDSGRVVLDGRVLFDASARVNVQLEERGLAYVPQDYALFPHLTVLANVEFAARSRPRQNTRRGSRERARQLLEELHVAELADRRVTALSGGEKQRVALARALAAEPRGLLLDEPLAALDVHARREVRAFLRSYLAKLDLPTIIVTHDAADAAALGHRTCVLEAGRIVQSGDWREIQANPASAFVAEFVRTKDAPLLE
jgi:molybdate transport system ATP-binding protein